VQCHRWSKDCQLYRTRCYRKLKKLKLLSFILYLIKDMTRPRRLYTNEDGKFYYLIDGKKKFVKAPAGISQKQIAKINIKNIVNAPAAKRIKRRRKRIEPAYGKKVGGVLEKDLTGGLPLYFFKPKRNIPTLDDQAEASADTTIDKLAKSILKLLPASSKIEPTVIPPRPAIQDKPKVAEEGTAGFKFTRQEFTNLTEDERKAVGTANIENSEGTTPYVSPIPIPNGRVLKPTAFRPIRPTPPLPIESGRSDSIDSIRKSPPASPRPNIIRSTTEPEPVVSQNLKGLIPPKPKTMFGIAPLGDISFAPVSNVFVNPLRKQKPRGTNNPLPITLQRTQPPAESKIDIIAKSADDIPDTKVSNFDKAMNMAADARGKFEEALRIAKEPLRGKKDDGPLNTFGEDLLDALPKDQGGKGAGDGGLYNDEIEKIVKKRIKNYVPVIAADEINELPRYVARGDKRFGFVINTNPSSSDGSGNDGYPVGHWTAVYINNDDDYPTVELFDPLAENKMSPALVNICRKIVMKMNPSMMFKYKQNMLRRQSKMTSNCGHHAIKFLDDRYNGVPWSEATGYDDYMEQHSSAPDDSHDGEKDIAKAMKRYESYI
jgi:hypothetical protein